MIWTDWINKQIQLIIERNPKGIIDIASGFGPSGKPHLGTLVEQLRVEQLIRKLRAERRIVRSRCFVDNMDGLRKIPPGFIIEDKFLNTPLCDIPYQNSNLAMINTADLKEQMNQWNITNEIVFASDFYQTSEFYKVAILILHNYQKILDIILPTLNSERKKFYSPFMPICNISGKIMQDSVCEYGETYIKYINSKGEITKLDLRFDRYKLQWHVNFAARWIACNTDFEMYGKDLISSAEVASQICKALNYNPPIQMMYELFLNDEGAKMSKSSGNYQLTPELWGKIAPLGSLEHFAFQNPQSAKKLTLKKIPDYVEEYLNKTDYYILHPLQTELSFRMLVHIARLVKFDIQVAQQYMQHYYKKNLTNAELLLVKQACEYAKLTHNPQTITIDQNLKDAIICLIQKIENIENDPVKLQTLTYDIGKKYFGEKNLVQWFSNLYIILLENDTGPRIGSLFACIGIKKVIELLKAAI